MLPTWAAILLVFKNISELNNLEYEIPEIVSSITDAYINSFPNYKKQNYDSELLATFLVEGDVQKRLFNSIFAPLSAVIVFE